MDDSISEDLEQSLSCSENEEDENDSFVSSNLPPSSMSRMNSFSSPISSNFNPQQSLILETFESFESPEVPFSLNRSIRSDRSEEHPDYYDSDYSEIEQGGSLDDSCCFSTMQLHGLGRSMHIGEGEEEEEEEEDDAFEEDEEANMLTRYDSEDSNHSPLPPFGSSLSSTDEELGAPRGSGGNRFHFPSAQELENERRMRRLEVLNQVLDTAVCENPECIERSLDLQGPPPIPMLGSMSSRTLPNVSEEDLDEEGDLDDEDDDWLPPVPLLQRQDAFREKEIVECNCTICGRPTRIPIYF